MKNRIAKLVRALADKLSPAFPSNGYLTPIKTESVEFNRYCVGYSYPKGQSSLNFDFIRSHLARQIGECLLKEDQINFSIDNESGYVNIIRAEVFVARHPGRRFPID